MCHVLVIEDEPLVADLICDMLGYVGATSTQVAIAEREAVAWAKVRRPTVITSDVRLASGTGPAAVAAIRAELGDIPTIFITATPDECEPCDHAVAILAKPFSMENLETAFLQAWARAPNS